MKGALVPKVRVVPCPDKKCGGNGWVPTSRTTLYDYVVCPQCLKVFRKFS